MKVNASPCAPEEEEARKKKFTLTPRRLTIKQANKQKRFKQEKRKKKNISSYHQHPAEIFLTLTTPFHFSFHFPQVLSIFFYIMLRGK